MAAGGSEYILTKTEAFITTDDGVRLWTDRADRGPDLVLAHGGPGLWDYLDQLVMSMYTMPAHRARGVALRYSTA